MSLAPVLPGPPRVVSPTTLEEALDFYAEYGLPVTPVKRGDKEGRKKGWSQPGRGATTAEFRVGDNVGVLNGSEPTGTPGWFFHDIDIDANSDAARFVVERLLPPTGWRYGRPSKPRSHANYIIRKQLRTRKFIGSNGKTILELRGITKKNTHTLSVAPGSTHESGEAIRFCQPHTEIGRVDDPGAFETAVKHAAVGIIIADAWPPVGARHDLRLAYAKVLLTHGLTSEQTQTLLEAVMLATRSDVADVADAVRDTEEAIRRGQPTVGTSKVKQALGDELGGRVLDAIERILPTTTVDESTSVVMRGGDLTAIVDKVQNALLATPMYQRGGVMTRAIKLDCAVGDANSDAVRRAVGSTVLTPVREPWLVEQMGKVFKWYVPARKEKGPTPADPKPIYARTLLARGEWPFPVLRGVVTAPTLDRDGRIIQTPGFDSASGLLLDFEPDVFPAIPEYPSRDEARAALDALAHPLRGFPFPDDAAKSVALSALLTALVRPSLRTSPLHAFDAPTAGTGKSLLAESAGLLATGVRPPALSQGKSDEEDEKRLSTVLFAGDPVIHIDNCDRPLRGDFLCSMLTQEMLQARILGMSERRVLPSTALVLASGNNLVFDGDVSRRAVVCRLDAKVERPDAREFDFDVHAEIAANRAALVVAGLTALRAYRLAQPVRLQPMGSFADWEWIRGALVWLGCADPAETRAAILESDPRKNDLLEIMDLWAEAFGTLEFIEVAAIEKRAEAFGEELADIKARDEKFKPLRDKLVEVACRGGKWSAKSVGWWLRGHKDRVVEDRCFTCKPGKGNVLAWRLTQRVVDGQPGLPGVV